MIITALKKKMNSKEWWQNRFVDLVTDIVTIVFGIILVYIFKAYII